MRWKALIYLAALATLTNCLQASVVKHFGVGADNRPAEINIEANIGSQQTTEQSSSDKIVVTSHESDGKEQSEEKPEDRNEPNSISVRSSETESRPSEEPEFSSGEPTDVQTTHGLVRGHTWRDSDNIISYIDIPYGSFNRFESPKDPELWEVHQITEHKKRCPQMNDDVYAGDLDCLTLSVFTPLDAKDASVLFYIHDSNFTSGSADPAIYGPEHLVPKGIILVLPNYRLGALGFLSLQNEAAPGNAALKDLALALSWTKENIAAFGGNPENIVVSGDGISGALVGYLLLSSKSKNYISKAITESGSVLSTWAIDRNPIATATLLADKVNELGTLEELDIETLITNAKEIKFTPCLENHTDAFIGETPWDMLKERDIKIPIMIGSATYAGIHEALHQTNESIAALNTDADLLLPDDLLFHRADVKNEIAGRVKLQYFGEENITSDSLKELSNYFTDASYLGPVLRTARSLVESGATVYLYEFGFVGDFNRELIAIEKPLGGAVIGDLVGYIFTQEGVLPVESSNEKLMVEMMVNLWVSFINTGIPTAENIVWNKLEAGEDSEEQWLSIDTDTTPQTGFHLDRMKLWTEIYNEHFIDRNLAITTKPSIFTVLLASLLFGLCFYYDGALY